VYLDKLNPKLVLQKLNYIHKNPVVDGIVENDYEYIYNSAIEYTGIKRFSRKYCNN